MSRLTTVLLLLYLAWVFHPPTLAKAEEFIFDDALNSIRSSAEEIYPLEQTDLRYRAEAEDAGNWENPVVSLQGGPMDENGVTGSQVYSTLQQPIPLYGRRELRAKERRLAGDAAHTQQQQRRLIYEHQAVQVLYEFWAAREELQHCKARARILVPISRHAESLNVLSPLQGAERDLLFARSMLVDQALQVAEERHRSKEEELGVAIAGAVNLTSLPFPKFSSRAELDRRISEFATVSENPSMRIAEVETHRTGLELAIADTRDKPDIKLALSTQSQFADSSQNAIIVGVELTLPTWNSGEQQRVARRAELRTNQERERALKSESLRKRAALRSQLFEAYSVLTHLSESLQSSRERRLERTLQDLLRGYGDTKLFLELEADIASAHERRIGAVVQFMTGWSDLMMLEGLPFQSPRNL